MQDTSSHMLQEAVVSVRQALARIAELSDAMASGVAGTSLCTVAERLYSDRRRRDDHFPSGLFGEPAWDLLLALFAAEEKGRALSVAEAFEAAEVGPAAGRRLLAKMAGAGLVVRTVDRHDGRRRHVTLTENGTERLRDYLMHLL